MTLVGSRNVPDRNEASSLVALKALLKGNPVAEATVDWNARPAFPDSDA